MIPERSNEWWALFGLRLAVAGGVAVLTHGLTDSYTLALVLRFTAIGGFDYVAESLPERPRAPSRLPLARCRGDA